MVLGWSSVLGVGSRNWHATLISGRRMLTASMMVGMFWQRNGLVIPSLIPSLSGHTTKRLVSTSSTLRVSGWGLKRFSAQILKSIWKCSRAIDVKNPCLGGMTTVQDLRISVPNYPSSTMDDDEERMEIPVIEKVAP